MPADMLYANSVSGSSVAASATVVTLLTPNPERNSFWIFNNSSSELYVKIGPSASLTDFSFKMLSGSFQMIPTPCPIVEVTGIWVVAVGNAKVTTID